MFSISVGDIRPLHAPYEAAAGFAPSREALVLVIDRFRRLQTKELEAGQSQRTEVVTKQIEELVQVSFTI
jgi:hypothetical protein